MNEIVVAAENHLEYDRIDKGNMTTKHFECNSCGAEGKINVRGDDYKTEDIVYCPLCSADIYEDEDLDEDE